MDNDCNDLRSKWETGQVLVCYSNGEEHQRPFKSNRALFHREANEMRKGFPCYFGDVNEVRMTAVGVSHMSCDRPERKSVDDTRQEGHWGLVSNCAVFINPRYFPACASCQKEIVMEAVVDGTTSMNYNNI